MDLAGYIMVLNIYLNPHDTPSQLIRQEKYVWIILLISARYSRVRISSCFFVHLFYFIFFCFGTVVQRHFKDVIGVRDGVNALIYF